MTENRTKTCELRMAGAKWMAHAVVLGVTLVALVGCGREPSPPAAKVNRPPLDSTEYGSFKAGPEDAPVKVIAYYPGKHWPTKDAIKKLAEVFGDKVYVEIIDWRRPGMLEQRAAAGLPFSGMLINGQTAYILKQNGKERRVLFLGCVGGDWAPEDLEAAVRQELAAAEAKTSTRKD